MKKTTLIVLSISLFAILLASSFVTPFWPFTGRAVDSSDCTETDQGPEAFVAGMATAGSKVGKDTCNPTTKKLTEYYCNAKGKIKKLKIECRDGCDTDPIPVNGVNLLDDNGNEIRVGRCKPPAEFCTDTDGNDPSQKGTTSDLSNRYEDSCSDDRKSVIEYTCEGNNHIRSEVPCQYGCEGGKCKPEPKISCEDTDTSDDPKTPGIVKTTDKEGLTEAFVDTCEGINIKEYSCNPNSGKQIPKLVACEGKCETKTIQVLGKEQPVAFCDPKPLSCTDTDAEAVNPQELKGTAVANDIRGDQTSSTDECVSRNVLKENSCADNVIKTDTVQCNDICIDGECRVRDNKCTDTDGGKDYAAKGTVTTQFGVATDFCADEKILAEFGCREGKKLLASSKTSTKIGAIYKKCDGTCSNGVCIGQSNTDNQDTTA